MKLVLHVCCSICLLAPLKKLSKSYDILGYYYNPNIQPYDEYQNRLNALKVISVEYALNLMVSDKYDVEVYESAVSNVSLEQDLRCKKCYETRLLSTAKLALSNNIKYFSTTLLSSPFQKHQLINETGFRIAKETGLEFISGDDWKSGYYESKKEVKDKNLYSQKYCGCLYGKSEQDRARKKA